MQRYKATIEYKGTSFVGFQKQNNGLSVQEVLEQAIKKSTSDDVFCYCAGRTDAGVHAIGQVAHFDSNTKLNTQTLLKAINFHISNKDVALLNLEKVDINNFHARFSAQSREYIYKIINRPSHLTFYQGLAWNVYQKLDVSKMQEAAKYFIGTHNLSSFRNNGCQAKSPIKTIDELKVTKQGDEIQIYIKARSFMYNQVRITAGTLKDVGTGKLKPSDIKDIIKAEDRSKASATAPAYGLYFLKVNY